MDAVAFIENASASFLENASASFEEICDNGPPAEPLPFDPAQVGRAERVEALVFNPGTKTVLEVPNVIYERHSDGRPPTHAYWVGRKLKKCTFGVVKSCTILKARSDADDVDVPWEVTERKAAVKIMSLHTMRQLQHIEDLLKEVAAMQLVSRDGGHPHVMSAIDILQDEDYLFLFMPFCSSGDLFGFVQQAGRFPEEMARYWFLQILEGLSHLQKLGICHRDMALENILVDQSRTSLVLSDFGCCQRVPYAYDDNGSPTDVSSGNLRLLMRPLMPCGTPNYISPEELDSSEPFDGFAIDLWASGVILFIMLVGMPPWEVARNEDPRYRMVVSGQLSRMLQSWQREVSPQAVDLLQTMLTENPRHRLSLSEIKEHPWVVSEASYRHRYEEWSNLQEARPRASGPKTVFTTPTGPVAGELVDAGPFSTELQDGGTDEAGDLDDYICSTALEKEGTETEMYIVVMVQKNHLVVVDNVRQSDTLLEVKKVVFDLTGIPTDLQELCVDGVVLDEDTVVEQCGIKEGGARASTVTNTPELENLLTLRDLTEDVERDAVIAVTIKTLLGNNSIDLQLSPAVSVNYVKSKIQSEKGIPANQQHLCRGDEELDDWRSLSSYGFGKYTTLELVLRLQGGAFPNVPADTGQEFEFRGSYIQQNYEVIDWKVTSRKPSVGAKELGRRVRETILSVCIPKSIAVLNDLAQKTEKKIDLLGIKHCGKDEDCKYLIQGRPGDTLAADCLQGLSSKPPGEAMTELEKRLCKGAASTITSQTSIDRQLHRSPLDCPRMWAISFAQLLDFKEKASAVLKDEFAEATMRDVNEHLIKPVCRRAGTSYALYLNPNGLMSNTFVSHAWDEPFGTFVDSIRTAFLTKVEKPNLWICSFALIQGDEQIVARLLDVPLPQSPFVQVLQKTSTFLVVRNSCTDLYSRIWCVCDLIYAMKFGLYPDKTYVTGPNCFSHLRTTVMEAQASNLNDKEKILRVLLNEHNRQEIDSIVPR